MRDWAEIPPSRRRSGPIMSAAAPVGPALDDPPGWLRRPLTWTWAATVAVLVLYAGLGWQRRWMSDDGLLVLRTVRQILAGHGPVFNVGERVEASTSPLWTWLLAALGTIPGPPLEWVAVLAGLLCAVGGLFFGLDGARRLYPGPVVPAGALVVCALPPFRDFATSGLETGLCLLWLGLAWWLLVRDNAPFSTAIVLGLGPLIRPDLALFTVIGFGALVLLRRPRWPRAVALLAAGSALPLAYQVFRMGYYGLLTPNTALAKEAANADWPRGYGYLLDLVNPYLLWIPLLLLGIAAVLERRSRIVVLAPVLSSILLALYVLRVGGDFMHGRMLLPALFAVLLPVLAIPLTHRTITVVAGTAVWAVLAGGWLRVPYTDAHQAVGVTDERAYWSWATRHDHPVLATDYLGQDLIRHAVSAVTKAEPAGVLVNGYGTAMQWYQFPADRPYVTMAADSMGAISNIVSLDVRIHDGYGLASGLASHASAIPGGRPGHAKWLPGSWEVADAARDGGGVLLYPPGEIDAARRALRCPAVREVLASVREPMGWGRFVDNLTGSVERTGVRYPRDPWLASRC